MSMPKMILATGQNVDFMIHGLLKYNFFGHEVWITTTHVCVALIMLLLMGLCLVVNRVIDRVVSAMETTIDDMMDTAGLPLLGIIPEDRNMTLSATFGRPVLIYSRRCPASEACIRIAQRLLGVPVPIALR